MVSDQPERLLMAELIREQVLMHTREEVPHSVAVSIDRVEEVPARGKSKARRRCWRPFWWSAKARGDPDRQGRRHAQNHRPGPIADADVDRWTGVSGAIRESGAGLASKPQRLAELGYAEERG